MKEKTKNQLRYGIEFETYNRTLSKYEIRRAILTFDREIESIPKNEIIERLPTSSTQIISITKLKDSEIIF